MAPRAQASQTGDRGSPVQKGKGPTLGPMELSIRAVSPGALTPTQDIGRRQRGRTAMGGGEMDTSFLVSHLPGAPDYPRMSETMDHRFSPFTKGN